MQPETRTVDPVSRLEGPWRWAYEIGMGLLAVVVLAFIAVESVDWVHVVNVAVWVIFVLDYVVRLALSDNRRTFVRRQWPDLVSILPADLFRIARAFRLFRLLRAGRVLWRSSATLRGVLDTNGLSTVLAVSGGVVLAGGFGIWIVEPAMGTLGDGIWWSIVTATTVGYGDLSPMTTIGRVLAVVLMIVGIGTIGMITGSIATYFIEDEGRDLPRQVNFVREELGRWHDLSHADRRRVAVLLDGLAEEAPA